MMVKVALLKSIDNCVGWFLCNSLSRPQIGRNDNINSVMIIRPGGIGDVVLLAPIIKILKKSRPHIYITILAESRNYAVSALISNVDKILCYDRPGELIQAVLGIYDVVIDTEQSYQLSAVVARLVRSSIKIGFDTNERRQMFTHCVLYDQGAYETDNFLALLKPLEIDCQRSVAAVTLSVPSSSVVTANKLLQPLTSGTFIAIFPGASIPEKRWGVDKFDTRA